MVAVCNQIVLDRRRMFAAPVVSARLGVSFADIMSDRRSAAPIARARHVAMYLAHVAFQLSLKEVGRGFGRDRTCVAYAVGRIEDERDDAAFDAHVEAMETAIAEIRACYAVNATGLAARPSDG